MVRAVIRIISVSHPLPPFTTYAHGFEEFGQILISRLGNKTKAEKVFGSNTARLRDLKPKYDPTCVFKKVLDLSPDVNGA